LAELLAKRSINKKGTGVKPVPFLFSVVVVASGAVGSATSAVRIREMANAPGFRARSIVLGERGCAGFFTGW